ncbi:hypothetical protein [Eubacterium sp. 1001713B170207_170306_E7]|uniref:hypothetical protein n=1 Tax=Eubacterium sp. 1001713B170207_170306_E7 TaxID=2787097 RepID=UPI001898F840|nr:hypothetical protein [Eubacterium sp. 1001713B170207_170306_E7]
MTNIKAERDPETGMVRVNLRQSGNCSDLIDEIGGITAALIGETIQRFRQAFEKQMGMDGEDFAEESVDTIAQVMQEGFQKGTDTLVKNGKLRKD